jgi:hypothetical protein
MSHCFQNSALDCYIGSLVEVSTYSEFFFCTIVVHCIEG